MLSEEMGDTAFRTHRLHSWRFAPRCEGPWTECNQVVILEALACGVPVAAFPVEGPIDGITSTRDGGFMIAIGLPITGQSHLQH